MNSLVSAIITTHDRQDLLVRAVKSVLSQTYKNLELIVVDDASDKRADELLSLKKRAKVETMLEIQEFYLLKVNMLLSWMMMITGCQLKLKSKSLL